MKRLAFKEHQIAYLFSGICWFFNNGGQSCYIVSVGTYGGQDRVNIQKDSLVEGLNLLQRVPEITLINITDALALGEDFFFVSKAMLSHCDKMQNRFAILDVPNEFNDLNSSMDLVQNFRNKI